MKRQLIAEQWNEFAAKVLNAEAPAAQRREMRLAFYAGAHAGLYQVIVALSPEAETTEADLQLMRDVDDELKSFAAGVVEGRY